MDELLRVARDKDGFLLHQQDWSAALAEELAAEEDIVLGPAHWELIALAQNFYRRFGLSPSMRPLVKFAAQELGKDKGNSIYFLRLFPGSPAKSLSRIAGLPRPENCF